MTHQEAWNQIPWLVNDSLDEPARAGLQQHLAGCSACRDELQTQQALLQAMQAGSRVEAMPPASLQKLWDRIDADPARSAAVRRDEPGPAPDSQPDAPTTRVPLRLAAVAAVVALVSGAALMVVFQSVAETAPPAYRTVSDAPAVSDGELRVVLSPDMTVARMQSLLERAGLRIVAGPTASGVYTLERRSTEADASRALAMLRADPDVRFAEPVGQ